MKKMLLASTSTLYGQEYLEYLLEEIILLFKDCKNILFIPYARPSGLTHVQYNSQVKEAFIQKNLKIIDYHSENKIFDDLNKCDGIFIGGGNTFLLLNKLYEYNLISLIKNKIDSGIPYLGTSAGTNICGMSIGTTNDMPIIHVKSHNALGVIPFNINPHYLDPVKGLKHMGESRETRIKEFHVINKQKVIGLREGSFLSVQGNEIILKGEKKAVIFEKDTKKYEVNSGFNLKNLI
tara:strand:- start:18 stop:725 length:708 start_codon:yes stop_codon:yes gene_type:complete